MMPVQQVPWRTVYLSIGLTVIGLAMFISGMVLWQTEGSNALIGLWVLGMLVFIPGFYFTRISYMIWRGRRGYSWDDMPDLPALAIYD